MSYDKQHLTVSEHNLSSEFEKTFISPRDNKHRLQLHQKANFRFFISSQINLPSLWTIKIHTTEQILALPIYSAWFVISFFKVAFI